MFIVKLFETILKSVCLESCCKFLGSFIVVLAAIVVGWHFLSPARPEADPQRKRIADKAVVKLVEDLRKARGEIKHVAVMHFCNDGSDYVTLKLRDRLSTSGVFDVEDADVVEKVRYILKLRNSGSFVDREIIDYGKRMGVQAVIAGNLERFESVQKDGVIIGTVRMIGIPGGEVIAEIPIRESSSGKLLKDEKNSGDGIESAVEVPWHLRFLIFMLAVLLLPVITITFIRYMVRKRSNGRNAFVLGIYTTVDLILACFMVGGFDNGLSVVIFIAAVLASLIYNLSIMSFALKLES